MVIRSIIAYKRFGQDNATVVYSPDNISKYFLLGNIPEDMKFPVLKVNAYVDKYCELYELKTEYGSNERIVKELPDHTDEMLVFAKDILDIQSVHIDLSHYGKPKLSDDLSVHIDLSHCGNRNPKLGDDQ